MSRSKGSVLFCGSFVRCPVPLYSFLFAWINNYFWYSMKKTYEPPVMEVWMIDLQRSADLLVSLSLQGNVSDFEPGDDDDLIVDDWGA